jgi:hypothetical protein
MSSKKYDIVAITGKYKDRDGNEKSRYMNIGAVIETQNGLSIKLEAVPVGWDGWAYLNEPKPREEAQQGRQQPQRGGGQRQDDRDIPFAPMAVGRAFIAM